MSAPPFIAGQEAFTAGTPISANPHDAAAPVEPDDYPGAHANWRDGWKHAYRAMIHTKKQEKNHG